MPSSMFNSSANTFFYHLIKEKPLYNISLLALSLVSTTCNVIGTTLLILILSILLGSSQKIGIPWLLLVNGWLAQFDSGTRLIAISTALFIIISLKNVANYISSILSFKYLKYLVYKMKTAGLEILCQVDFDYYQKNKTEDILLKLNREIDKAALAVRSIQKIGIIVITIAILGLILIVISWQLTTLTAIVLGLTIYFNNWLLAKVGKERTDSGQTTQSFNRRVIEFLAGIRSIKTAANEEAAYKSLAKFLAEKDRQQLTTHIASAVLKPMTEISSSILVLMLVIASYSFSSQAISETAPSFLLYLIILFRLLPFIGQFNNARLHYVNTRSSIETVANFLNLANKPLAKSGELPFLNLITGIKFKAVTFAYPNHGQIILDRLDLWIPQGKTIALIGFPGTGNSIITDLLTRFYEPIEGQILLDSKDITIYDTASLRKATAVVSRDTFLFNGSLAFNIAYGLNRVKEDDIAIAAKQAQLDSFIQQLPAGLDTEVGEWGIRLSVEQKQKVSLARAFLRNPQILVLDEPFEFLEGNLVGLESVQDIIYNLSRNRTTIVITKQLELAKTADCIMLFSQGKIIETGTHQQLLQQRNIYHRLYSMQFKNQQFRQLKLAQKIARKLTHRHQNSPSEEIRFNLNNLLNNLELLNQDLLQDRQDTILDESFQSAKDILRSLRSYEEKISQGNID